MSYAVRSVVRNRRASASALVGLALGVAVATAPWIALDSSLRGIYDHFLKDFPYDALAIGPYVGARTAAAALSEVEGIERAEPVVWMFQGLNASASGVSGNRTAVMVTFVDPTFDAVRERLGVTWTSPPVAGGALVHDAWRQEVDPGDVLVLEQRVPVRDENGTVVREDVFTTNLTVGGFFGTGSPPSFLPRDILASSDELPSVVAELKQTSAQGWILTWVDREALIDPFDAGGTTERLGRVETLARVALAPTGYWFEGFGDEYGGGILHVVSSVDGATFGFRLIFFALAVPTLGMAALLAKVGFDVGLARRRRELAILRARGVTVRRVRAILLAEAVLLALLATAVGLALALVLSRLFVVPVAGAPAVVAGVGVSTATALLGAGIAVLLAVAASHRVVGLVATEDLVRALKAFHAEEVAIPYRASRDFLAAAVGAAGLILLLAFGSLDRSQFSVLVFLLGFSASVLAPMAPFFLAIGVARYLTRGTTRTYRVLARALRRALGELHVLVDRNLARSPRRSSNTAMIVTFAVAFVVAVQTFAASADTYREEGVLRSVPADLVVRATYYEGFLNASTRAALQDVPGVASISVAVPFSSNWGRIVFFETATYLDTVPWLEPRHLDGTDPYALTQDLGAGDRFAANEPFRTAYGWRIGEPLPFVVYVPGGELAVTATLSAYVPSLPGLTDDTSWGETVAVMDLGALGPAFNASAVTTGTYLIALALDADPADAREAVSAVFGHSIFVPSQAEARRTAEQDPVAAGVFGYLRTQGQLAVLLVVVAVGLLVYSAAAERRDEFATLVARGAGPRAVARVVMAEGLVVSILGFLLGVAAGLVTAWAFLTLVAAFSPGIPFVVPLGVLLPLLAVVLGVWLASYLGALAIQRMDVPRVLKLRGG